MKIQIKKCKSGEVIYSHEAEENSDKITVMAGLKAGVNFNEANLSGMDLSGIDFSYERLTATDFSHANLAGANLGNSEFYAVNFTHANLEGANLKESKFYVVNFCRANLSGADIRETYLSQVELCYANFSNADFSRAIVDCDDLRRANFTGAKVKHSGSWLFATSQTCFKIDIKLAYRLATNFCLLECDDPEWEKMKNALLPYVMKSDYEDYRKEIGNP